jgi:biotin operon repressor
MRLTSAGRLIIKRVRTIGTTGRAGRAHLFRSSSRAWYFDRPTFDGIADTTSDRGEPLYRQIYLGLRRAILSGALRNGERIPSTRDLADRLGVSRTSVVLAYDRLSAEGFVTGRDGSGSHVAESPLAGRPALVTPAVLAAGSLYAEAKR